MSTLTAEKIEAIKIYCDTGTDLATHPDLPEHVYDTLVEHARKLRETFSFEDLQTYAHCKKEGIE